MGVALVIEPVIIHPAFVSILAHSFVRSANMFPSTVVCVFFFFVPSAFAYAKEMQTKCNATTKRKLMPKEKVNMTRARTLFEQTKFCEMSLAKRSEMSVG